MQRINLKEYKNELREVAKEYRLSLSPEEKGEMDRAVLGNVLRLRQYKKYGTLFIYVSTPIEVGTREIIASALAAGKKVAVPRCIPGKYEMTFHYIESLDDLHPGAFSVDEPDEKLPVAEFNEDSLMILPALVVDRAGYRIGYGKGYYDRYMSGFSGPTAGLCYSENFVGKIHHGRYDYPVDVIVTQSGICSATAKK